MKALRVGESFYINSDSVELVQRYGTRPGMRELKRAREAGTRSRNASQCHARLDCSVAGHAQKRLCHYFNKRARNACVAPAHRPANQTACALRRSFRRSVFGQPIRRTEMNNRLTIAQAARVLGMSERTLRRHVAEGKIEAVKGTTPETGTAWFLDAATIEALAASPISPNSILVPKEEQEDVDVPTSYNEDAMPEPLALLVERLDALLVRSTLLEERVAGIERELEWQRAQQARHLTVLRARWPFGKR